MSELTQRCLALPKKDRAILIKVLKQSLHEKDEGRGRFGMLYKVATSIVGNGILTQSRDHKLVTARKIIAYTMRCEGYSLSAIGRAMNRNHASVMYMLKMWEDVKAYPDVFREDMEMYEEFNRRLEYEEKVSSKVV